MILESEIQKNSIRHAVVAFDRERGWRVDSRGGNVRIALLKDGSALLSFPPDYDTTELEKTLGSWASELVSLLWRYFKFECSRILLRGLATLISQRLISSSNDTKLIHLIT